MWLVQWFYRCVSLYIVKVNMYCYLCGRSCELWNNRSVSLCSCLTPTDKDRRETLWCEGSYIWRKGRYGYLSEQTIKQITIGEQGWHSGGSVGETPPTSMARADAVGGLNLLSSLPFAPRGFSQGNLGFSVSEKRSNSKFHFDQKSGRPRTTCYLLTLFLFMFHEKILKKEIKTILMGLFGLK